MAKKHDLAKAMPLQDFIEKWNLRETTSNRQIKNGTREFEFESGVHIKITHDWVIYNCRRERKHPSGLGGVVNLSQISLAAFWNDENQTTKDGYFNKTLWNEYIFGQLDLYPRKGMMKNQ